MIAADPFSQLKTGWFCFALPGIRDHPSNYTTYSLFAYETLPPLQVPEEDSLGWLLSQPLQPRWSLAENGDTRPDLSKLPDLAARGQVGLPAEFSTLMQSEALQARLRSCTACFLELNNYVVRTRRPAEGVLLHFLSDQQWCLHWHLYLTLSGAHCVLVSGEAYGFDFDPQEPRRAEIDLLAEEVWLCAPTFAEFLYRFWLENEIFFRLFDKLPLTAEQQAYADFYRQGQVGRM